MIPRDVLARPAWRHKVPFSTEVGRPCSSRRRGSHPSDLNIRERSDTLTCLVTLRTHILRTWKAQEYPLR